MSEQITVEYLCAADLLKKYPDCGLLIGDVHGFGFYLFKSALFFVSTGDVAVFRDKSLYMLNEAFPHRGEYLDLLQRNYFTPGPYIKDDMLKGLFCPLGSCNINCFYHWIIDFLPRVMYLEGLGFDGSYLIPVDENHRLRQKFIYESLHVLGLDKGKFLEIRPYLNAIVQMEYVVLPPVFHRRENLEAYNRCLAQTARAFLKKTGDVPELPRVFLSRRNTGYFRRTAVLNYPELLELLRGYGFTELFMEDYDLQTQVSLASRINCLVALHGAGLAHALFMPPGSVVYELIPPGYRPNFEASRLHGHRHFVIPVKTTSTSEDYECMEIDLDTLEAFLLIGLRR